MLHWSRLIDQCHAAAPYQGSTDCPQKKTGSMFSPNLHYQFQHEAWHHHIAHRYNQVVLQLANWLLGHSSCEWSKIQKNQGLPDKILGLRNIRTLKSRSEILGNLPGLPKWKNERNQFQESYFFGTILLSWYSFGACWIHYVACMLAQIGLHCCPPHLDSVVFVDLV